MAEAHLSKQTSPWKCRPGSLREMGVGEYLGSQSFKVE